MDASLYNTTYLHDEVKELGGTFDREVDSVAVVTIWYVPGGDYVNAVNFNFFFNDMDAALKFEQKNSHPPECPFVIPLDTKLANELYPLKTL